MSVPLCTGVDIDERQLKKGVSSSKSPGPVGERKSGRPVNRNQRSHGRQLRTRKVFETEYRTQFKAWPLPSSQVLPGTRGKKGMRKDAYALFICHSWHKCPVMPPWLGFASASVVLYCTVEL